MSSDETSKEKESLNKERVLLYNKLEPLIREYLIEIKSSVSVSVYLQELAVTPISIDGILMGFWGLQVRAGTGSRKLATMKALYLKKEYRGRYLNRIADDLIRGLLKQGVTELEIWSYPGMQKWLEKRYGIKPNIYVTYNPIEIFRVFKD